MSEQTPSGHTIDCGWHLDQYPWECTCGVSPTGPGHSDKPKPYGLGDIASVPNATDVDGDVMFLRSIAEVCDKNGPLKIRPVTARDMISCLDRIEAALSAQGMEAEGRDDGTVHDSPVAESDAPQTPVNNC